jgi:hypothetical protein
MQGAKHAIFAVVAIAVIRREGRRMRGPSGSDMSTKIRAVLVTTDFVSGGCSK